MTQNVVDITPIQKTPFSWYWKSESAASPSAENTYEALESPNKSSITSIAVDSEFTGQSHFIP